MQQRSHLNLAREGDTLAKWVGKEIDVAYHVDLQVLVIICTWDPYHVACRANPMARMNHEILTYAWYDL